MLTEYLLLNARKIIVETLLTFLVLFLCAFAISKIFNISIDYASFSLGVIVMSIVIEIFTYRKWLRSN